jgi:hypothetical protein
LFDFVCLFCFVLCPFDVFKLFFLIIIQLKTALLKARWVLTSKVLDLDNLQKNMLPCALLGFVLFCFVLFDCFVWFCLFVLFCFVFCLVCLFACLFVCFFLFFVFNCFSFETRFQHVVWVGCSAAHTEVLVLTYKILDLDNLQMMTSSWFEQIHKWNTLSTCSVSRKSSGVHSCSSY